MGYTNYWHQHNDFTDIEWGQIKEEYDYIKEVCEGIIVDDSRKTDEIVFNGKHLDHETFVLNKNTKIKTDNRDDTSQKEWIKEYNVISSFNFCKTARKPYDLAVWHLLCFVQRVCPNFAISRDR